MIPVVSVIAQARRVLAELSTMRTNITPKTMKVKKKITKAKITRRMATNLMNLMLKRNWASSSIQRNIKQTRDRMTRQMISLKSYLRKSQSRSRLRLARFLRQVRLA